MIDAHRAPTRAKAGNEALSPLLDEDGFLVEPETWTEETARRIASAYGIFDLQPAHWSVIHFIRDYYRTFGAAPLMRRVCRSQNMTRDAVKELFGGCMAAWCIAGLPNPGEEAKSYMS